MTYQRIVRLTDSDDVARVVAARLLDKVIAIQQRKDTVHLCLTGGNTANAMYEKFAELVPGSSLDGRRLQLWWGDERFVPATDEQRNSLQALSRLARTLTLNTADIHPMPAQEGRLDAHQCAAEYAAELGDTRFDITLLGIGEDGHVGSIFPNHASFEPTSRSVIGVTESPKPPSERITLTLPTMNRSDEVWFIATGPSKATAVGGAVTGDQSLPAAHVRGEEATYWFVDHDAAEGLPTQYVCPL